VTVPVFALLLAALFFHSSALAETVSCRVVGVADGDTLTCLTPSKSQLKVRLAEIDTPESSQPYGNKAKQALAGLVFGKEVRLLVQDRDRYGRIVARVEVAGEDVNRQLVAMGAAWVYRAYNRDKSLLAVEAEARAGRLGLWGLSESDRVAPWDWRKGKRQSVKAATPSLVRSEKSSAYQCGTKRYCKEMSSCAEAVFHLNQCGLQSLDGDRDGTPCEALCR
jgi:endonuclease YncB( thermonuclease family)